MGIRDRLSGNEAVALAMKSMNLDVMAAFPITPSTEIPQYFSQYVAEGEVKTVFVPVEGEHSAMSACIGAQAAGARAATATSSCGLALMFEMLHVASSLRLPITMACVTRALTGPINIHNDHGDAMAARDCGWIQIHAENAQEAYDNYIMSPRIGEHKDVLLPVMSCQDGFITSHAVENIELMEDAAIKGFVGHYEPEDYLLNAKRPISFGPYDAPAYLMEHKRQQAEGMLQAPAVILQVFAEFERLTGRKYSLIEAYKTEDAERVIVLIGSTAGTAKQAVDDLREKGEKVGLVKVRVYRPFPAAEIAAALRGVKAVAVMDKAEGLSAIGGPLFGDVLIALNEVDNHPCTINYVYGIGGRDVRPRDVEAVFDDLARALRGEAPDTGMIRAAGSYYRYLALREED